MTDKELTIWEHLDSVMRVLTCKEMGAWLYRRDKRVLVTELEKLKSEIEEHNRKYLSDDNAGLERAIWDFIEPRIAELKGEQK